MEPVAESELGVAAAPALKEYPWNTHTNWQRGWKARCERVCCHTCGDSGCATFRCGNGPCADIGCQNCGMSIVRPTKADAAGAVTPDTRFVCLDCLHASADDRFIQSADFCPECFANPVAAHCDKQGAPHLNWLRIDGATGAHTAVVRERSRGVVSQKLTVAGLTVLAGGPAVDAEIADCEDCYCFEVPVDDGEPNPGPCHYPGCEVSGHEQCCAKAALSFLEAEKKLFYVLGPGGELPPATYFCNKCNKEDAELKLRTATTAEVTAAVLGGFSEDWTVAEAEAALECAPSLAGRPRVHQLDLGKFDSSSKLAVAEYAVAELKEVHAGKANAHLHVALDKMLVSMRAALGV